MALLFSCISGADVRETAWKVGSGALKESEACATQHFCDARLSLRKMNKIRLYSSGAFESIPTVLPCPQIVLE